MMQTSTPARIPEGLAGAIALLKQNANPIAPGPGGAPRKSVVGAMMDDAERTSGIASLGTPPMGDTMPEGTMYGAAEDLRNALPTMERNAQEEQLNQIAQRVRGMDAAETGIAPMAGEMNMAEGGIIGYSGEDKESGQLVELRRANPLAGILSTLFNYFQGKQREEEAAQLNKETAAAREEVARGAREPGSDLRRPASQDPRVPKGTVLQDTKLGAPMRVAAPPAAPAAPAVAETDITPPTAPTIADIQQLYTKLGMGTTEPRMLPAAMEQVKKRMAERPTSESGIAAIQRAAQEREESAPMDRLRQMFGSWARHGLGGPEVAQFDAMLRESRVADAKAIDSAKRADYALAMGDDKAYADLAAKADDDASKAAQVKTAAYNGIMQFLSDKFRSEVGIFGAQERTAAQRDIAQARIELGQQLAAAKAAGNKPLEMTLGDKLKLLERVETKYPIGRMTPDLEQYIVATVPNGDQLIKDYKKDPKNAKWTATLAPITQRARDAELQNIIQGTRAGAAAQPRPFTDFLR